MGPMNPLLESEDVAWFRDELTGARGAAAALARRIGLDAQRAGQVALAVSELASNLSKHAVDGVLLLRVVRTVQQAGIEVLAMDRGPGMVDVAHALRDGVSSTGTLGIGLGAVVRLADSVDVESQSGRGTVLAARFWAAESATPAAPRRAEPLVAGLTRAINGEQVCGDAWAARRIGAGAPAPAQGTDTAGEAADQALLLMLCDGLGHGPMAAIAAEAAVKTFRESRSTGPAELVSEIHRALRGTRGAALAVARIEREAGRVLLCGVGNISAMVVDVGGRAGLLSMAGIVGHQLPTLRTFDRPLPSGSALVLHSDGLSERWDPSAMPGFPGHSPVLMAAQLLQQAGVRHDDASIVVAKAPVPGVPW
jgi:anti-sigma regulatory factor (Ser/Thr protein kinase)